MSTSWPIRSLRVKAPAGTPPNPTEPVNVTSRWPRKMWLYSTPSDQFGATLLWRARFAAGQRTQSWLAVSEEPAALVTGRYWHHLAQQQPASEATDPKFQDALLGQLSKLTGVELPEV